MVMSSSLARKYICGLCSKIVLGAWRKLACIADPFS